MNEQGGPFICEEGSSWDLLSCRLAFSHCLQLGSSLIVARSTFLRKYFPKSSVPHIFGRHFLAVDFWLRWFLPIFACRGGPGSAARCGGGPRGTQKLIRICFFCSPEPFTKIFWKRKPRENLAKTSRKPCENPAQAAMGAALIDFSDLGLFEGVRFPNPGRSFGRGRYRSSRNGSVDSTVGMLGELNRKF